MTLQEEFEIIVQKYVDTFCEKQECDFDGWVGDDVGGIGCFGGAYLNLNDVRYDIDTNQLKGEIFDWYWDFLYAQINGDIFINYESYSKGLKWN